MTWAQISHLFSPSQISTYRECKRKWAFGSIAKIRGESNKSAALGTECHSQLETYLSGGQLDYTRASNSGYIVAAGLHHLPPGPHPKEVLESKFKFRSPVSGFYYHGIRDMFLPPRGLGTHGSPEDIPLVLDHKTTGNLSWAKSSTDLETDVQAIIYAYSAFAPLVRLRWVYYQTKGARKSLPVEALLGRSHVEKEFAKIELTAQEMATILLDVTGNLDGLDRIKAIPPSPDACEGFGGCQYRHICNLSPSDRIASFFGKPLINLKKKEDINMSNASGGVQSLIERLRNKAPGSVVQVANEGTPLQSVTTFTAGFVNPPPVQAPVAPPAIIPERAAASPSVPGIVTPIEGTPAAPVTKRGPGRPKKDAAPKPEGLHTDLGPQTGTIGTGAPEREPAIEGPDAYRAETLQEVKDRATVQQVHEAIPTSGYSLFVDCLPDGHVQDMAYIFGIARKAVAEKAGVPDYRMIEYGAGPGYLSVAVGDLIEAGMLQGNVFVSTGCQETAACLSTLVQRARSVVRGIR